MVGTIQHVLTSYSYDFSAVFGDGGEWSVEGEFGGTGFLFGGGYFLVGG